ncbi:MAG: UDP-N-acetylmuramoyl-tripeptide--D-alanyl-D-alanine ligase [Clostridia bacterium]|nr:UDP-N-acetylmuramoyl-tripeptide--D-alanyl-D-alanine ligase [Clostridia bacterium]
MGIFVSVPKTIECIALAVVLAVMLSLAAYKPLGVLQSSGYSGKKFFKWVKKKGNLALERLALLALCCVLCCGVASLCFSFTGEWAAVIGMVPVVVLMTVYCIADTKIALRSSVTHTPRLNRLYVVLFVVLVLVSYIAVTLLNFADEVWGNDVFSYLRYCPVGLLPLLLFPLMAFANLIAKIYEVPHNGKFIKSAKAKLKNSDIKIIGITGSYGKTSTKFILNSLLSRKYRVLCTPRSHNTPVGIALAVNNAKLEDYDIFIAEMGARHIGDIAELCEICPPDVSLITGICGQHLETFKTFSNVVKAKGEILDATKEHAVIAEDCYDLFAEHPVAKSRCSCVTDIECTAEGTVFTLTLGGESRRVKCKLLGAHSARNIALAAEAAYAVGMTVEEIAGAVEEIEYIEHRLQLIKSGGVNILDDGYNSNVKGAAAAIEVLKLFGGRKIAVTPGLVELGVMEEEENFNLGKKLVGLDFVILVGDTLVTAVKRGYVQGGGEEAKLIIKPTLAAAQEALKEYLHDGDTVLFLNDLPDVV